MENHFQNIFPKISGSQEDNQISIFGCPHSIFGRRGHEDTQILLPWSLILPMVGAARVTYVEVTECLVPLATHLTDVGLGLGSGSGLGLRLGLGLG